MKVKIKTWKKMEEEYGLDEYEEIDCYCKFMYEMEVMLPEDRIIEIKRKDDYYVWNILNYFWNISDDMIEQVVEE